MGIKVFNRGNDIFNYYYKLCESRSTHDRIEMELIIFLGVPKFAVYITLLRTVTRKMCATNYLQISRCAGVLFTEKTTKSWHFGWSLTGGSTVVSWPWGICHFIFKKSCRRGGGGMGSQNCVSYTSRLHGLCIVNSLSLPLDIRIL